MILIKVVRNEKTSLKIISAKTESTENKLRTCSKHKMTIIQIVGNEKLVQLTISAKTETTEMIFKLVFCSLQLLLVLFSVLGLFSAYFQ